MRIPDPDRLNPAEARKAIAAGKSNKPFVAALLDGDHPDHRPAVDKWFRLHQAAYPEPGQEPEGRPPAPVDDTLGRAGRSVAGRANRVRNFGLTADASNSARPVKGRLRDDRDGERSGSSDDRRGEDPPVVNMAADRIQAILDDAPARFEIRDNPDADRNHGSWRAIHAAGANAVSRYASAIEREVLRQGVDADLVKAIMYVENAHGFYGVPFEPLGLTGSIFPMNIKPDPWSAISNPPADLTDPETNIRVAVTLIARIAERIEEPTPAKVASIWNFTGRELVNDYGARVQDVYDNRLWENPVTRRGQMRRTGRN